MSDKFHCLADGVVDVVGGEEFVAGRKFQRSEDAVDAFGGVGDEAEVFWFYAKVVADREFGGVDECGGLAAEDFDGVGFDLAAPEGLLIEDDARDGAERAVVEEG